MHLAHRIDPGRVWRRGELDFVERDFISYRSKRLISEIMHQDAFGGGSLGNWLGGKQLAGTCKRGDARCYVDGRSEEIIPPADDRPMVQPRAR
jgi:hypothetical protein